MNIGVGRLQNAPRSETAYMNLEQALANSPYPGRGLLLGRTDYGLVALYWVTGRSEASRQRQFVSRGTGLHIEEASGAGDDPLRHYQAAGIFGRHLVVGNGRHVDEIGIGLGSDSALTLLESLEPEPDPPIFTPRIAAVVDLMSDAAVCGAAVRALDGSTDHNMLSTNEFPLGTGVLLVTHQGAVAEPASWAVPTWIELAPSLEEQVASTWDALDGELRVGLASCVVGSLWNIDRQI
jgi:IMP cyclohydrolase